MGRPDTRHLINQDYGRRLYVPDQTYDEQMGVGSRKIAFTQNSKAYQQSNLKKPYREDAYEDMEYEADPFVGYSFDYPNYDSPIDIQPDDDTPYSPWHVKFLCFADPCYCFEEKHCVPISCQWPITGCQVTAIPKGCYFKYSKAQICAQCPEGETGWITFDVKMLATFQHNGTTVKVEGTYYNMHISSCDEDVCVTCAPGDIAWDNTNSAKTLARFATGNIVITDTGTNGPYTWTVEATGTWQLGSVTTEGLTNTLRPFTSSCGTAKITVTGCDGAISCYGYVRCSNYGSWQDCGTPVQLATDYENTASGYNTSSACAGTGIYAPYRVYAGFTLWPECTCSYSECCYEDNCGGDPRSCDGFSVSAAQIYASSTCLNWNPANPTCCVSVHVDSCANGVAKIQKWGC